VNEFHTMLSFYRDTLGLRVGFHMAEWGIRIARG
jgi:hypothetical protein